MAISTLTAKKGHNRPAMQEKLEYLNRNEINALLNSIDDTRDHAIVSLYSERISNINCEGSA
jgi:hypothetical protein